MTRSRSPLLLAFSVWLALDAGVAHADSDDDAEPATYAVQNRRFNLGHEFHASVGLLPLNAFTKGLTIGGGYTYHISDSWAWEVGQFVYSYGMDTGLKTELKDNFQVQPTQLESVKWFASSNLVVKPLYGKFAWFNDEVVHAEIFLAFGAGVGKYENPSSMRPAADAGAGVRLHVGSRTSIRFDARNYAFFKGSEPKNELYLALTFALSLGGGAR